MKFIVVLVILLLVSAAVLAMPIAAASPSIDDDLSSSSEVANLAPVIDQASLLLQSTDEAGINWQLQNNVLTGDRTTPYLLDGETLHVETDVSDSNGTADLDNMSVKMTLGNTIEVVCNKIAATSDTSSHYGGDLTIDSTISEGSYSVVITAADLGQLSDSYDTQFVVSKSIAEETSDESEVTNEAPVIDRTSLLLQLTDGDGVNWQSQNGTISGNRAVPYIFDSEKLHVEMDISDSNGTADADNMTVIMTLGTATELVCSKISTTSDTSSRYGGDLVIDSGIVEGTYNVVITATDPGQLTDSYDTQIAILKPTLTLQISALSLNFSVAEPGAQNIVALENPVVLSPQATIGTEHIPVVFSILQMGTDMSGNGTAIPAGNTYWSSINDVTGANPVTMTFETIVNTINEGETITVYYWLNIPLPQAAGTYNGSLNYRIVAD